MDALVIPLLAAAGPWALALVAGIVCAESGLLAGFFLPGDSMLFATGVLVAAGVVPVPLGVVMAVVSLAACAGNQLGFFLGRRLGPRLLNSGGSRLLTAAHVARAQRFFAAHGARAVFLARFVPVARTVTPVIAGAAGMNGRRFLAWNVAGAVAWPGTLLMAGAWLGGVGLVAHHIALISLLLVGLSLIPAAVAGLRVLLARRSRRRAREVQHDDCPAVECAGPVA